MSSGSVHLSRLGHTCDPVTSVPDSRSGWHCQKELSAEISLLPISSSLFNCFDPFHCQVKSGFFFWKACHDQTWGPYPKFDPGKLDLLVWHCQQCSSLTVTNGANLSKHSKYIKGEGVTIAYTEKLWSKGTQCWNACACNAAQYMSISSTCTQIHPPMAPRQQQNSPSSIQLALQA